MRKLGMLIIGMIMAVLLRQTAYAAGLSVRLEQPKTPTNQQEFDITFVTLDLTGRDVTVTCLKKSPTDADYVAFGAIQTFANGGNTGVCPITSSILSSKGTYGFKVIATAGSDSANDTTSIEYNNEGPGDPTNYSKERTNVCDYKIKFHTADDSGKTIKVEVYRSENTTFAADSGSRVDTIVIGSNTDGQSVTTPPSCDKEYYFAIRAFDTAGNGSNLVGDSQTTITKVTTPNTTTNPTTGAILLTTPGSGSVLGTEEQETGEGAVLGKETTTETTHPVQDFVKRHGILLLGIILLAIGITGLYVAKKKTAK